MQIYYFLLIAVFQISIVVQYNIFSRRSSVGSAVLFFFVAFHSYQLNFLIALVVIYGSFSCFRIFEIGGQYYLLFYFRFCHSCFSFQIGSGLVVFLFMKILLFDENIYITFYCCFEFTYFSFLVTLRCILQKSVPFVPAYPCICKQCLQYRLQSGYCLPFVPFYQ